MELAYDQMVRLSQQEAHKQESIFYTNDYASDTIVHLDAVMLFRLSGKCHFTKLE